MVDACGDAGVQLLHEVPPWAMSLRGSAHSPNPSSPREPKAEIPASPRDRRLEHNTTEEWVQPGPELEPRPTSSRGGLVKSLRDATQGALPSLKMVEGGEHAASAAATFQGCVFCRCSFAAHTRRRSGLAFAHRALAVGVMAGVATAATSYRPGSRCGLQVYDPKVAQEQTAKISGLDQQLRRNQLRHKQLTSMVQMARSQASQLRTTLDMLLAPDDLDLDTAGTRWVRHPP